MLHLYKIVVSCLACTKMHKKEQEKLVHALHMSEISSTFAENFERET